MGKEISEGDMPPLAYRLAHPEARLPDAEKRQLIEGLRATSTRHLNPCSTPTLPLKTLPLP